MLSCSADTASAVADAAPPRFQDHSRPPSGSGASTRRALAVPVRAYPRLDHAWRAFEKTLDARIVDVLLTA